MANNDAGMPAFAQDALSAFHHFPPDYMTEPLPVPVPTNDAEGTEEATAAEPVDDAAAADGYPSITSAPSLVPRAPPNKPPATTIPGNKAKGVFVCNQPGWKGNCWVWSATRGICQSWDHVQSMGPDKGLSCDLYAGPGCQGEIMLKGIKHPGISDTHKLALKSWKCH